MTRYISINKHVIARNARHGTNEPAIAVRTSKSAKAQYCHEAEIQGPSKLVYSPDKPILRCGARLVLITEAEVTTS